MTRRTVINLVAIGLATAALLLYGLTQLLVDTLFDPTYPLHVELPASDGLLANKQVSYNGATIGQVEHVSLAGDRVRLDLAIDEGVAVPADVDVAVVRSSPIGEQRLDIRPVGDGGPTLDPGDRLRPRSVSMPTDVQGLLELATDVLEPVDDRKAGTVVAELADAVRGRRDDIRGLIDDSGDLSAAIAANGADYDRFFATSRQVNAALADSRRTLGRLIGEIGDATAVLTAMRDDYEALLASGPPVLSRTADLVWRGQPNLSCSLADLSATTAYLAEDEQRANLSEALRLNQWFFEGFNRITPQDARGNWWQRIHLSLKPFPPARGYRPGKRPVPATLPGGACASPVFGAGAPAATQADFEITVPDGRVEAPANDRAEPVRRGPAPPPGEVADPDSDPAAGDDAAVEGAEPGEASPSVADAGDGSPQGAGDERAGEASVPWPDLPGPAELLSLLAVGALAAVAVGVGVWRIIRSPGKEDDQ